MPLMNLHPPRIRIGCCPVSAYIRIDGRQNAAAQLYDMIRGNLAERAVRECGRSLRIVSQAADGALWAGQLFFSLHSSPVTHKR